MLAIALFAQLAAAVPARPGAYESEALQQFVAEAAVANREPPPPLRGYRARLESELSFIIRDTLGREQATQIEQIASDARWSRSGTYAVHVLGYRTQSLGAPFSALSFVNGWTMPTLYGNRLDLGIEPVSNNQRRAPRGRDTIHAVHPLATDRDQYYRYGGGDTVAVLRTAAGTVPIVRVHAEPLPDTTIRIAVFEGDLDFDATRHALVRMRGRFLVAGRKPSVRRSLFERLPGFTAVAYAELVNAQLEGSYWLPTFQRAEFQASAAIFGDSRSVFRLVSRFRDYALERDSLTGADSLVAGGRARRATLSFAPGDSLASYGDWTQPLGAMTVELSANDFDDVAPPSWRPGGPPRLHLYPRKFGDVLRYDRVEGFYTGASATMEFRDAAPGLSLRALGGYAWAERTARGGATATLVRGNTWLALRGERELALTNDFTLPYQGPSSLSALFASSDDGDYVDRRLASLTLTQALGSIDAGLLSVEARVADDRAVPSALAHGTFNSSRTFRPNRGVVEGTYVRSAVTAELHPNVSGDFLQPGVGARLRLEAAAGELTWQRAELAVAARRTWRTLLFAAHGEAGVVLGGAMPPQTLFELGGAEGLPGYGYKEFAGDRAASVRALVAYTFPVLNKPKRIWRGYVAPGLAPGLAFGASGGWTELATDAARTAAVRLATLALGPTSAAPLTPPGATHGMRATVDARVTFFSGALGVGVARPVDHAAPWRMTLNIGQAF